ncbi:MAG: 1-deoxy-D-xylulose-5-phosphate synthase, partial [Bacilli bacterium]|nr:1-deoxy-D-xylulose-5-phosphate synthase [Bacilli bacterium]
EYILDVVSKNGGHLASNLGVVELTIALESVFDVSRDKIVWDVGHQCYTHKIINGRYEEFKTLRKFKGLSGFPKTSESLTDAFNTGHSSTSISAAMGFAKARDIRHKKNHVVAVIGDGALTGGMAMEALNHVGSSNTNMIVVLNDNEMSISKNIGGINKLLTRLRSKKNYTRSNQLGRNVVLRIPLVGGLFVKLVSKLKTSVKNVIIPGMYFEEIGFRYLGPVDGHDINTLEKLLSRAKELDGPILIHVLTKKGKGYSIAEDNPDKFHGVSAFDLETGKSLSQKKKDYSKVFGDKLVNMAKKNKKIVAITAAMKDGTGFGEFAAKYPERFFDVGIAEGHALTFAAGLAREGLIPFVSIYSSFYQRAYDQIIHDICLQELPVVMCVDRAGIVGNDGETHQGLYDMAFFRLIPNLTIMAPKDFSELEEMMEFAVNLEKPVVIRYPRGGESGVKFTSKPLKYGKSEVVRKGNDLSIIAIGNKVSRAMEVAELLDNDGISSEVINCRFLKPLDTRTIGDSLKKTAKCIVIEDGTVIGGLSSAITELILEKRLDVDFSSYAYPDKFIKHGSVEELEKQNKVDAKSIFRDVKNKFKF